MHDTELVWRGLRSANPWWDTGQVPPQRTRPFRRAAFAAIRSAVEAASPGRGVVLLGPRRIGKTVLLHQLAAALLAEGADPRTVVVLALDDVALGGADLGPMLDLLEARLPLRQPGIRYLLLDEVQHAEAWSAWLKRIADRRDPYRFLATGSSASALRVGSQDAGLGRWREMVLYPWSFREHVHYRHRLDGLPAFLAGLDAAGDPLPASGPLDRAGVERLNNDLLDYIVRGGFPEVLDEEDWREAQRHLRQDILERALARDIAEVERADARALERMFLRVCKDPGGVWNATTVGSDLGLSRPTVGRYLHALERAFLLFSFPNLASPVKGLSKVYLVAPSMRAALLGLDHERAREPVEWGLATENLVAATLVATRGSEMQVGFWREGGAECDAVALGVQGEFIEVKTGRTRHAARGIEAAARGLRTTGDGVVLTRDPPEIPGVPATMPVRCVPVAVWLYGQRGALGGTLRLRG